jgi:hypothetical protein
MGSHYIALSVNWSYDTVSKFNQSKPVFKSAAHQPVQFEFTKDYLILKHELFKVSQLIEVINIHSVGYFL